MKKKSIFKYMDYPLLFASLFMFLYGLIMIFSASNVTSLVKRSTSYDFFIRQAMYLSISLIPFILILKIPIKSYKKLITPILYLFDGILLFLLVKGDAQNGIKGWLKFGFISVQPSEFAKIVIIIFLAIYYQNYINSKKNDTMLVLKPLIMVFIPTFLTLLQPDLGTAIIIATIIYFIFISIPINSMVVKRLVFIITSLVVLVLSVVIIDVVFKANILRKFLSDYQYRRFDYYNPCSKEKYYDDINSGLQLCNSYIAINNGGIFGVGLSNSTQKYLYLPIAHSDFIMAIVFEELGLIGFLVTLAVLLFIIVRIIRIAKKSIVLQNSVIAYGIAIYLFCHMLVNLTGIMGIFPMTGVPFPFISYGGSYALCLMIALALVQRVVIETNIFIEKQKVNIKLM